MKKFCLFCIFCLIAAIFSCQKSKQGGLVVTSPEIADVLVSLDAQDLVVAATRECALPNAQTVGNFGNVDFAKVVKLNPKAVLATGLVQDLLVSKLQKLQIPVYKFYARNVPQMLENVLQVGKICGKQKRAAALVDSFRSALQTLELEPKSGLRVYAEISAKPLVSTSGSSFVGDLLKIAGGKNIFDTLPSDYPRVRQEAIIKADPQVIFCFVPGVSKGEIARRLGWQNVAAVRNQKIYTTHDFDPDELLRATPACLAGIRQLKKLLADQQAQNK